MTAGHVTRSNMMQPLLLVLYGLVLAQLWIVDSVRSAVATCRQWGQYCTLYLYLHNIPQHNKYDIMNKQERVKGRFKTHVCDSNDCACYECSVCNRRIAYKPAFVKHQLFSDCTPHLTPELKASDLARENRHRVQVPNPGDSCAGVTGDSAPNCDSGEGSGGQGTAPAQHQGTAPGPAGTSFSSFLSFLAS